MPSSPKPPPPPRTSVLTVSVILVLCAFSFLLGVYNNHQGGSDSLAAASFTSAVSCDLIPPVRTSSNSTLDFAAHHNFQDGSASSPASPSSFEPCDPKFSEYTPCEDRDRSLKFDRDRLVYRERHCPAKHELLRCLVPAPFGYRNPFPWPASRGVAWFNNVPHKELTVEKAVQNWIRVDGDKFRFPGGGTMFPNGADAYIGDIDKMINLKEAKIRTAIDTGCGVIN